MTTIPAEKAIGALLGAAIGDSLGWPQERLELRLGVGSRGKKKPQTEFQEWRRRSGSRFNAYEEVIYPGEYSDDTQLLLAVSRSLIRGKSWSIHFASQELPVWLLYQRGGGRNTTAAARSWQSKRLPWSMDPSNVQLASGYFSSGANGAVMRVLPHALLAGQTSADLQARVMLDAALTHGHPRAILGAKVYAHGARFLATLSRTLELGELVQYILDTENEWGEMNPWASGYSHWLDMANKLANNNYENHWKTTKQELIDGLLLCRSTIKQGALATSSELLSRIGAFDSSTNGAGTVCAIAAIFLASIHAATPTIGLLESAFLYGADTDTIASLVGGLLGALAGTQWIKQEWNIVQDRNYISNLANELAKTQLETQGQTTEPEGPEYWTEESSKKVINQLSGSNHNSDINLGPLGTAQIIKEFQPKPITRKWSPSSWQLCTEAGQTIYITKLDKSIEEPSKSQVGNNLKPNTPNRPDYIGLGDLLRGAAKVIPNTITEGRGLIITATAIELLELDRKTFGDHDFFERTQNPEYHYYVADHLCARLTLSSTYELVPLVAYLTESYAKNKKWL